MYAVTTHGADVHIVNVPEPVPEPNELLVSVAAAGLNGKDDPFRLGQQPAPDEMDQRGGYEMSGTVVDVGRDVHRYSIGDRVMGIVAWGHAEFAVIHEDLAMSIPASVSMTEAGGFPIVYTTADDALFTQCGLIRGERLLVTGAAGGVGTAAVQIARAIGATAVASVRDTSKFTALRALGAEPALTDDAYAQGSFDVIIDLAGTANIQRDLDALRRGGRLSLLSIGQASRVELDLRALNLVCGRIHASGLTTRPFDERVLVTRRVEHRILPFLASRDIHVPIDATFPLANAAEAYAYFRSGGKFGKVILAMG